MKRLIFIFIFCPLYIPVFAQKSHKIPKQLLGTFKDDYGIEYQISDSLWLQFPNAKYHILKWNKRKQYLIAKNDADNKSDGNKYTRIDYMLFDNMAPYNWGFCLTAYQAETDLIAEKTASADRKNPKKGCNGYPFSRMKVLK